MNIQKFTQKSLQAVEGCEKAAYEYGNQEIEQEHLLYSLLTLEDSLILKLIEKMEIQKEHFVNRAERAVAKRTKVQGGKAYVGKDLNNVLLGAENEAKQLGDEYVSVEHLFLAMLKEPNREIEAIWKEYGITRERFLQAARSWWRRPGTTSLTLSSAGTGRSGTLSGSSPGRPRTTLC